MKLNFTQEEIVNFGQDIISLQKYLTLPKLNNNELIDDDKVYAVRISNEKDNFEKFKNTMKKGYTNSRNMISGIVNSKTIDEEAKKIIRNTDFVTYDLINPR